MPPKIHNASAIASAVNIPIAKQETGFQRPRIEGDPLSYFETYHFQIQTDLKQWMTLSEEDRLKKARDFARSITERGDQDKLAVTLRITRDRRVKILNYIIWIESHHPHGNRDVAAVAFNGLFGVKEK